MRKERKINKSNKRSKIALGLATGTLALGSVLWITFGNGANFPVPADRATKVIDGDTFYTQNAVRMRLADLNAPEIGRCGAAEATKRLKELILHKPIYIKTKGTDQFNRNQALVFTDQGLVNLKLIEEGLVVYRADHNSVSEFKDAGENARKEKRGIFGPKCTQLVNKKSPECNIKANINYDSAPQVKHYYYPGCNIYTTIVVNLYQGDRWFCTQTEAKKAGFTKPKICP